MALLEIEKLCKSFGGLIAVNNINVSIGESEIIGLIGPNGAGKSTLFNLISGLCRPDTGSIKFRGHDITGMAPYKICQSGIARTFQLVRPFNRLTVLENVMIGRAYGKIPVTTMKQAYSDADEILEFTGLINKRDQKAGMLSLVDRKRLEIARALALKPELLLLDEVFAGLNASEINESILLIKQIKKSGIVIVIVEHVMQVIMSISDRVIVLNIGEIIADGTPQEIANNEKVIEAYLGHKQNA